MVFAILVGLVSFRYLGSGNAWLWMLLAGVGGVIPDIDIPQSWVGRKSGVVSEIVSFAFGHRGFIHSVWMVLILSVLMFGVVGIVSVGLLIGYLSHLFLDCFTKQGIYLFYPFRKKVRGFVRSGGLVDWLLFWVFFGGVMFIIFSSLLN